jgi:hypothetical protein
MRAFWGLIGYSPCLCFLICKAHFEDSSSRIVSPRLLFSTHQYLWELVVLIHLQTKIKGVNLIHDASRSGRLETYEGKPILLCSPADAWCKSYSSIYTSCHKIWISGLSYLGRVLFDDLHDIWSNTPLIIEMVDKTCNLISCHLRNDLYVFEDKEAIYMQEIFCCSSFVSRSCYADNRINIRKTWENVCDTFELHNL